ncbi:MAG: diaminopimelate epimerase, partial [Armatimonadetes bacterium]|nr:diaminopimelate epimerase [Armatimonadota bacterium]
MLQFTKMHGLGNDFVMVDAIKQTMPADLKQLAVEMNDRRFGIGGDGLILVLKGQNAPFKMRMLNPDGSESEMCGNGIRCFAKYVRDRGLTDAESVPVETGAGLLQLTIQGEGVRVNMGKAKLLRGEIPMAGPANEPAKAFDFE